MLSGNKQCRVLSIQSHVVSGYVGNKAATFPLQVLGFEVDAINSVQFSNHTGYKQMKGQVLNSVELRDLYEGLKANEIHHYSHLLTDHQKSSQHNNKALMEDGGFAQRYVGSESFLKEVLNVIKALKETNPNLVYVCDPVLGDNGKFYVPECLVPIYRDELLPFADLITPNQFEAELLSEIKIHNEKDAFKAIDILHKKGVKTVVISSLEFGNSDQLILLASIIKEKQSRCIKLTFPKLNAIFTGTGDLFHSMLLAWLHRDNYDIKTACEKTVSAMHVILERTLECAQELAGAGNTPNPHQRELKLIQSLDDIRHPQDLYKAEEVTPPDISS